MAKKVLIVSTSIRPGSNSEILANAFADGAKASGNEVEIVSLRDKTIGFCRGCFACQKLGHCVIKDDANEITEKLLDAQVVVWATPIYYYEHVIISSGMFICSPLPQRTRTIRMKAQ